MLAGGKSGEVFEVAFDPAICVSIRLSESGARGAYLLIRHAPQAEGGKDEERVRTWRSRRKVKYHCTAAGWTLAERAPCATCSDKVKRSLSGQGERGRS